VLPAETLYNAVIDGVFAGLPIDEINQPELTQERI
jgi:hypothetical protein